MRKAILGVAIAGVVASVAILAQSQLSDNTVDDVTAAPSAQPEPNAPSAPSATDVATPETVAATAPRTADQRPVAPVPNTVMLPVSEQTNPSAAVLRRASTAYTNVKSLRADFVQKRDNPLLGSTTTSRGTIYQKQPDRFLMQFSDPAGDVIVSDGEHFWLYYPSADRRQVLRAPAAQGGAGGVDLQAQFLGDPLKRFTPTYHGTETLSGRNAHVITLVPRENVGYQSLKVWVDAKDAMVRRFVLTENNGLVQEFQLSNLAINPALSNDLFRFTPPADARIVDRP
jgi:outer membrane lipoprotein-sorting protein